MLVSISGKIQQREMGLLDNLIEYYIQVINKLDSCIVLNYLIINTEQYYIPTI